LLGLEIGHSQNEHIVYTTVPETSSYCWKQPTSHALMLVLLRALILERVDRVNPALRQSLLAPHVIGPARSHKLPLRRGSAWLDCDLHLAIFPRNFAFEALFIGHKVYYSRGVRKHDFSIENARKETPLFTHNSGHYDFFSMIQMACPIRTRIRILSNCIAHVGFLNGIKDRASYFWHRPWACRCCIRRLGFILTHCRGRTSSACGSIKILWLRFRNWA